MDAARRALSEAKSLDEVKDIRDKTEALRAYFKAAHVGLEMQNDAAELKLRAERRAGGMLAEMEKAKAGRPPENRSHDETDFRGAPTLSNIGISKSQSHRWQAEASVPAEEFERYVSDTREQGKELTSAGLYQRAKKGRAPQRDAPPLPEGLFDVVYADPPWRYRAVPDRVSSSPEHHYPTMDIEVIKALEVPAADNAVLFLWGTAPLLPEALQVIDAWGFEYRTGGVWDKVNIGIGYWFRGRHEHLLVGVRGSFKPPAQEHRVGSVFTEKRTRHSSKPDAVREWIEAAFPDPPHRRLEMFARESRDGWTCWGNEAGVEAA